jgi:hypothetical protein
MYPLFSVSKNIILVGTEKHAINGGDSELMSYLFYRENGKWQYHVFDAVYRNKLIPFTMYPLAQWDD